MITFRDARATRVRFSELKRGMPFQFLNYNPTWGVCFKLSERQYVRLETLDNNSNKSVCFSEILTLPIGQENELWVSELCVDITVQYPLTPQLVEAALISSAIEQNNTEPELKEAAKEKAAIIIADVVRDNAIITVWNQRDGKDIGPIQPDLNDNDVLFDGDWDDYYYVSDSRLDDFLNSFKKLNRRAAAIIRVKTIGCDGKPMWKVFWREK